MPLSGVEKFLAAKKRQTKPRSTGLLSMPPSAATRYGLTDQMGAYPLQSGKYTGDGGNGRIEPWLPTERRMTANGKPYVVDEGETVITDAQTIRDYGGPDRLDVFIQQNRPSQRRIETEPSYKGGGVPTRYCKGGIPSYQGGGLPAINPTPRLPSRSRVVKYGPNLQQRSLMNDIHPRYQEGGIPLEAGRIKMARPGSVYANQPYKVTQTPTGERTFWTEQDYQDYLATRPAPVPGTGGGLYTGEYTKGDPTAPGTFVSAAYPEGIPPLRPPSGPGTTPPLYTEAPKEITYEDVTPEPVAAPEAFEAYRGVTYDREGKPVTPAAPARAYPPAVSPAEVDEMIIDRYATRMAAMSESERAAEAQRMLQAGRSQQEIQSALAISDVRRRAGLGEAVAKMGISAAEREEARRARREDVAFRERSFEESIRQFDVGSDQWVTAFEEGIRQFDVRSDQWDRQFTEGIRQFDVGSNQWERMFQNSKEQWGAEYGLKLDYFDFDKTRFDEDVRRYGIDTAYRNQVFNYNKGRDAIAAALAAGDFEGAEKLWATQGVTVDYTQLKTEQARTNFSDAMAGVAISIASGFEEDNAAIQTDLRTAWESMGEPGDFETWASDTYKGMKLSTDPIHSAVSAISDESMSDILQSTLGAEDPAWNINDFSFAGKTGVEGGKLAMTNLMVTGGLGFDSEGNLVPDMDNPAWEVFGFREVDGEPTYLPGGLKPSDVEGLNVGETTSTDQGEFVKTTVGMKKIDMTFGATADRLGGDEASIFADGRWTRPTVGQTMKVDNNINAPDFSYPSLPVGIYTLEQVDLGGGRGVATVYLNAKTGERYLANVRSSNGTMLTGRHSATTQETKDILKGEFRINY